MDTWNEKPKRYPSNIKPVIYNDCILGIYSKPFTIPNDPVVRYAISSVYAYIGRRYAFIYKFKKGLVTVMRG
jgi:hypothetical protein